MKLYRLSTMEKHFKKLNPLLSVKEITEFFLLKNIFGDFKVKSFYLDSVYDRGIFLNISEAARVCQLIRNKLEGNFSCKTCPFIESSETTASFSCTSFKSFSKQKVNFRVNPLMIEKHKAKKAELNTKKIANQPFAQEANSLNINTDNKKIVAIDFEFSSQSKFNLSSCTEFGICTLENNEIHYQHYLIEETYQLKVGNTRHLQDKFEFGSTQLISIEKVKELFEKTFQGTDYLLFHDMSAELAIFRKNNIQFEHIKVLDTTLMYQQFTQEHYNQKRLKDLLRVFNLPYTHLHNSGNDAAHTMQVFLAMLDAFKQESVQAA